MKYKIIKALDVAGLHVFEPIVRLCYWEQPREQAIKIGKFIVVPVLVFAVFLGLWSVVAPRHKTKYGEVPTPGVVWDAFQGINTFHDRENTKQADYHATGEQRLQLIDELKAELATLKAPTAEARKKLQAVEAEHEKEVDAEITPLQAFYKEKRLAAHEAKQHREADLEQTASKITPGDEAKKQELLDAMAEHNRLTDAERSELDTIKSDINDVLAAKAPVVLEARQQVNELEQRRMFLEMRLQRLESDNREIRLADTEKQLADQQAAYAAASGAELIPLGKQILYTQDRIETAKTADPAGPWTFFEQIFRSLACVFLGFAFATAIAIPVGILCGLSPVIMASMTPLISLFKPVSPIVWLPIVLIIVGGFYANPDQAWVQPSFLASAITVALCSLWPTLTNTALGVAAIDKDHINVARVLRLGFFSRLIRIVIPSALPLIFAGMRISLGVGWMVLIAAELLSSSEGIGKFVWDMFNNGSSQTFAQMFVVVFFVGIIGMLLDRIMIVLQRLVSFDDAPTAI